MTDAKAVFPARSNVFCGTLTSKTPTECGAETLFSYAGHLNDERRLRMLVRMYERLVIAKHRMLRIYVSNERVKRRYMKRFKDNDWDEDEERDCKKYLQQEREIWEEESPHAAMMMFSEEEEEGEGNNEGMCGSDHGGEVWSGDSPAAV